MDSNMTSYYQLTLNFKTWHSVFWKNNDRTDVVDYTSCPVVLFVARVPLLETIDVPICFFDVH